MSTESLHECPDCDCIEHVFPNFLWDWEGWVEEERRKGLAAVHAMFRPLRFKVGLATMSDVLAVTYEKQILQQLKSDNFLFRKLYDSQD